MNKIIQLDIGGTIIKTKLATLKQSPVLDIFIQNTIGFCMFL